MGLFKISSTGDIVIIAALLLATTVVLFQNKIAGFVVRLGIFEWINNLFLSKGDKKYFDNVKKILSGTSDERLASATSRILEECGRSYQEECVNPSGEVLSMLPPCISSFWRKFDYLDIANDPEIKMLDIKGFKEMKIGESIFYVIGADDCESSVFLIKKNSESDRRVYEYNEGVDDCPEEDLLEEAFSSIEKCICYYYSVVGERELNG